MVVKPVYPQSWVPPADNLILQNFLMLEFINEKKMEAALIYLFLKWAISLCAGWALFARIRKSDWYGKTLSYHDEISALFQIIGSAVWLSIIFVYIFFDFLATFGYAYFIGSFFHNAAISPHYGIRFEDSFPGVELALVYPP